MLHLGLTRINRRHCLVEIRKVRNEDFKCGKDPSAFNSRGLSLSRRGNLEIPDDVV